MAPDTRTDIFVVWKEGEGKGFFRCVSSFPSLHLFLKKSKKKGEGKKGGEEPPANFISLWSANRSLPGKKSTDHLFPFLLSISRGGEGGGEGKKERKHPTRCLYAAGELPAL